MPVSPETGNKHAGEVVQQLTERELLMLQTAVATLRGDQDDERWAAVALQRIQRWRAALELGIPEALADLNRVVREALAGAYLDGWQVALVDLPGVSAVDPPPEVGGLQVATTRLGTELATAIRATPGILEGVLREAVAEGTNVIGPGTGTRRQATQRVLDRLVRNGVTGFRDKAGRQWSLTSYAEMATRTALQDQALRAGEAAVRAVGLDLVQVSDSPRECPVCRPYEGKVLSLNGERGRVTRPSETGGAPVVIDVLCPLSEARARGFQHPNCTHSFGAFIPGASRPRRADANPEGYEQRQEQRRLERKVREWKRAEALALDPDAAKRARAKVREWQAAAKANAEATGVRRNTARESITRAV